MDTQDKPTIYIETTIPSLYTSRSSPNIVEAARQKLTIIWWNDYRNEFRLVTSQTVHDECSRGDKELAAKRIEFLSGIPLLKTTDLVGRVAKELILKNVIPPKYADDAIHAALASVHSVDYLLTWNCKHLANPMIWWKLTEVISGFGLKPSIICTPEDLIGDEY